MLLVLSLFQGCGSSNSDPDVPDTPETPDKPSKPDDGKPTTDWQEQASKSTQSFVDLYWNSKRNFFNYYPGKDDGIRESGQYWPQAHAMDVLIDAYIRTGDDKWKTYFDKWYVGVKQKSGGSYFNNYVDDMEWICLTMIRLYENTKEDKYLDTAVSLWNKINSNWNTQGGGGIAWKQTMQESKNACSNGPAGIIAARLYQLKGDKADLEWAQKIYNWQSNNLYNIESGAVYDNLNAQTGVVNKDWIFTYNQGTYMGMAYELYKITGEDYYLTSARKAATYCINNLIDTKNKILKDEGNGDGGLFKGIFIRYFVKLVLEKDVYDSVRKQYVEFFNNNAKVLMEKGTGDNYLYSTNWAVPGTMDNDMPTQVSGCTMIEAKALYEREIAK
ncbi:MAG: glycoside hydrolase family 76 protein [Prevotella sp.]